jgi:hypothetical protein
MPVNAKAHIKAAKSFTKTETTPAQTNGLYPSGAKEQGKTIIPERLSIE